MFLIQSFIRKKYEKMSTGMYRTVNIANGPEIDDIQPWAFSGHYLYRINRLRIFHWIL